MATNTTDYTTDILSADDDGNITATTCNSCCSAPLSNTTSDEEPEAVIKVFTLDWKSTDVIELIGPRFEEYKNDRVKIDVSFVSGFDTLFSEIENDARLGLGLFDVFITPPTIMGAVVPYNGFADLTAYIQENYLEEWLDIFSGYREIIASYNGKILMIPFDGDLLHLFYNKEILDYYNFQPPRTWQEYNDIAEQVHDKVFPPTNKTLIGSCIGRVPQCAGPYWAVQVLSSMTQTKGSSEGSLFDTKDMTPLTSDALVETLKIFERQLKYGHPDEFDICIDLNLISMENEECVLSLNWGNAFLQADVIRGKLGIDKVPGSQKVLDRETGKLVTCNKDICPNAVYYDDIGFVNYAPYAAFGGWSGAVNGNISDEKKKLAMEFLTFSASKEESRKFIATLAILNFIALVLVNVQAYHARSINDELSESKYIGLATLSMFQIFIVGVPLLVIVYNDPSAYFFVWCGIIFIICTTILLLIFVPKVLRWKSGASDRSATANKFTSKWSHGNNASSAPSHSSHHEGDIPTISRAVSPASEVENNNASRGDKRVSFDDKESEIIHREKLDEIQDLVMEKHNIDITSIILKVERTDEAVPVAALLCV